MREPLLVQNWKERLWCTRTRVYATRNATVQSQQAILKVGTGVDFGPGIFNTEVGNYAILYYPRSQGPSPPL